METIHLGNISQTQAKRLVASGAPVYVLVNPVEYHGPHLPLSCDAILSEGLMGDLHAKLHERGWEWPLLVFPPLHLGSDPAPGGGTVAWSYLSTKRAVLRTCRGLKSIGARRVVFMTFHGSPFHGLAIDAGVRWLKQNGIEACSPFNVVMKEMLDYEPSNFLPAVAHLEDPQEREFIIQNLFKDFHGGFFETSLMLNYHPDWVAPNYTELPSCPEIRPNYLFAAIAWVARRLGAERLARECGFIALGMGWLRLKPFPGYTGWPQRATVEAGAFLADYVTTRFAELTEAYFRKSLQPPRPILKWIVPVTLNGTLNPQ
ncbi:MAG: creatininase family protein [Bdellovibrionota bacterium]